MKAGKNINPNPTEPLRQSYEARFNLIVLPAVACLVAWGAAQRRASEKKKKDKDKGLYGEINEGRENNIKLLSSTNRVNC